ncbi:glycosyltransferase [Paraflavitalea pollutisoli]|uniref:glycosyltransferase n=1 Tax=Paraflavitalea pollutisoli TaxID=3034143 RepID=UPI0023ED71E8|nr:glycosyltransferase [Paraflavitalea sp. H1-2-19X]
MIDERLDILLLAGLVSSRPHWHFVLIGPVVKIDPVSLPQASNLHYLGGKQYDELPAYLGGWDVAMMPFARNQATRYISPTKTPEYLAGGKPVISTSIQDVIHPYGALNLVEIADTPEAFITCAEKMLSESDKTTWLETVDAYLITTSWDKTWQAMVALIAPLLQHQNINQEKLPVNV